jgi:hypothetical protein
MMKNNSSITIFLFLLSTVLVYWGCSKSGESNSPSTTPVIIAKNCIMSGISQHNSGVKAEFSLTIHYNDKLNPTKIIVYDSTSNTKLFDASLTYASADSIRIDAYQYMKLDSNKRVKAFITKEDLNDPLNSDTYLYEYVYSSDGYLVTKNLYINGSSIANFSTSYSYTNGLISSCLMTAVSSGNKKVLESTLKYDESLSPKTMIYTFPDAFESYYYSTALSFGTRPSKPLKQVVTKLYNPANGVLLDTWSTNYSGYNIDENGYLSNGNATGDLQQGIANFFGKTFFFYQCQ